MRTVSATPRAYTRTRAKACGSMGVQAEDGIELGVPAAND